MANSAWFKILLVGRKPNLRTELSCVINRSGIEIVKSPKFLVLTGNKGSLLTRRKISKSCTQV